MSCGNSIPFVAGIQIQESSEGRDPRSTEAASEHRLGRSTGSGVDAGGQGFCRQDYEQQQELGVVSHAVVDAALKARRVKALLSPIVDSRYGLSVYRGSAVAGIVPDSCRCDDGWISLLVFCDLIRFFKPVKDLASMTNSIAQAAVGVDRVRAILDADDVIPERSDAVQPESSLRGKPSGSSRESLLTTSSLLSARSQFQHRTGSTGWRSWLDWWRQVNDHQSIPRFYDAHLGQD